jgi:hypothetical protein
LLRVESMERTSPSTSDDVRGVRQISSEPMNWTNWVDKDVAKHARDTNKDARDTTLRFAKPAHGFEDRGLGIRRRPSAFTQIRSVGLTIRSRPRSSALSYRLGCQPCGLTDRLGPLAQTDTAMHAAIIHVPRRHRLSERPCSWVDRRRVPARPLRRPSGATRPRLSANTRQREESRSDWEQKESPHSAVLALRR